MAKMKMTRTPSLLGLGLVLLLPGLVAPAGASDLFDVPSKWFKQADGFEEALQVQKETGADLFIYFRRMIPEDQKGLCRWFEKRGLKKSTVSRYLRDYIKVEVTLPSNDEDEKVAERFEIGYCPVVVILQPSGWRNYCRPFDWPQNKPQLKQPDELIELFRANSSAAYQAAEDD